VCSYVVSLLRPQIIRDLDLPRFGLELIPLETAFTPLPDGDSLCRWSDPERTRREIERHSKRDAEVYPQFGQKMMQLARFVKPIIARTPPSPTSFGPSDLGQLLGLAKRFGRLDDDDRAAKLKMMTMSAADFLEQWFECEPLKATMAVSGIIGTFLGV